MRYKINKSYPNYGVVDLLLTIALGIAIGTAALIVGSEMAKDNSGKSDVLHESIHGKNFEGKQKQKVKLSVIDDIQKILEEYLLAKKRYEECINSKKSNEEIEKAYRNLLVTKEKLEIKMLQLIPGILPNIGSFSK